VTTRKPDDLTDPRVDAAWRAVSREEPPRALDDAIRAAARREAGAGPRRTEANTTAVPAALRPARWWWPLAAAATIGAVAIGLLQLAPPDKFGAPADDKIVSDMPAAPAREKQRSDAARDEITVAPREEAAKPSAAPAPVVGAAQAPASAGADARVSAGPAAALAPPETPALSKDAAAPIAPEERASARTNASPAPASPPATSAPVPAEKRRQAGVESVAPAPVAEPFPADTAKREAKEAVTGGVASAPAKTGDLDAAGIASGKLAAAPAPLAQSAAPAPLAGVRKAQETEDARAPALAKATVEPSADAKFDMLAKERAMLPVAEWIALIRKLRDEGRTDEAAKELAAFRAVYPDHERRLPPDLRDWRPAGK